MGLIGGIWLMLLGVLGAANLIIARKPEAKEIISKIAPYQGWIGVISAFWGIWGIISSLLSLGWLAYMPIYWITYLATAVLQTALGILLGIGTMKTFIKQPQAVEKLDALVAKMAPKQGVLGFVAIGAGLWMILAGFLFMHAAVSAAENILADNAEAIAAAQQAMQAAAAGAQMTPEQQAAMAKAQQQALQAAATAAGQMTPEQQAALANAARAAVAAAGQMTPEQQAALAKARQQALQAATAMGGQLSPEQRAAMAGAQQQAQAAMQQAAGAATAAQTGAAAGGGQATALVQQTWSAGVNAEQQPLMGMDLYVTPLNGAPYQVRLTSVPVPAAKQVLVQPQRTITVSIDSANPMNVTPLL